MGKKYATNIQPQEPVDERFIDRYKLGKMISDEGGFGTVYETVHPELHQKSAIKILRNKKGLDAKTMIKIRTESLKTAQLREHKNIIQELDAGDDDGQYFIVMELMHGSLADLIGEIPIDQVEWVFGEAAAGIKHIHSLGYVHQDIKPANFLLRYDLKERVREVKVSDFGLAISQDVQGSDLWLQGGTREYMAPEVLKGNLPTIQSDIYSLGVTFYEVLTGQKPTNYGKSEKPSKLRQMPRKLAKKLDPLILQMIER